MEGCMPKPEFPPEVEECMRTAGVDPEFKGGPPSSEDEEAIKELETVTKCKVHTFVSTVSEIISAIEKHLHIKMNSPTEPSEHISKVSFRSAVQQKTERLK